MHTRRHLPSRHLRWIRRSGLGSRRPCAGPRTHVALLAGLILLAGPIGASDSTPAAGRRELRILLASPQGEQDQLLSVDVSFSEPMVPLGKRGERGREGPILIEPALKGSFTWIGTSAVSFLLEAPPPAGTRFTCTVPRGTRSLSGDVLPEDHHWTIEYRRPHLLASIPVLPPQGEKGPAPLAAVHPPEDPLLFAFDGVPAPEAWEGVHLSGAEGEIELKPVAVRRSYVDALASRNRSWSPDSTEVLAVRPRQPLRSDAVYTVRLPADLPFRDGGLGLAESVSLPFRTLAPPGVQDVEAVQDGLLFHMWSETDPDSLLARLRLAPRPEDLEAGRQWDGHLILVRGGFHPGSPVLVEVLPGIHDLFGRVSREGFTKRLVLPHAGPRFSLQPQSGVLLPGPGEFVSLSARNVGSVKLRAVWVLSREMPVLLRPDVLPGGERLRPWQDATGEAAPWRSRWVPLPGWDAPAEHPDSLCSWTRTIRRLLKRPKDGQALVIEAQGVNLFPADPSEPDTLRQSTVLQVASLGISSRIGSGRGLFWITDLLSGRPVDGAEVSLWSVSDSLSGGAAPLWKGRTDAEGIAWSPGRARLGGQPDLAMAQRGDRRIWLPLSPSWESEPEGTSAPNAAFVFTDRPIYRPGETMRWKAFVRRNDAGGLHTVLPGSVTAVLSLGEGETLSSRSELNENGNAQGEISLPPGSRTGYFALALYRGSGKEPASRRSARPLGSAPVQVEAYRAPRFEAKVETSTPRILSGSTAIIEARFAYFAGPPLSGIAVRWFVYREPLFWRPDSLPEFSFQDDLPWQRFGPEARRGPEVVQSGEGRLDTDGRIRLEVPLTLPPEAGDSRITVEVGARDLTDQSAFNRVRIDLLRGPLRPAVRVHWADEDSLPGVRARRVVGTWEWLVADTSGTPRPGIPVTLELVRREWKTVRIRRVGGIFDYENTPRDTVLAVEDRVGPQAPALYRAEIPVAGYYLLRARVRESDGTTLAAAQGRTFWAVRPGSFPRENAEWVSLQFDRKEAGPGDTVRAILPAPAGGAQGLFVLEDGGILGAWRRMVSGVPQIAVPLSGTSPPEAYVSATLVGPDRVPQGEGPRRSLPYFAQGNGAIQISRERWRAKVAVTPDRALAAPGEDVTVEIRLTGPGGGPVSGEAALAVVDEAVLALANPPPSDPLSGLFPGRGTGTVEDDTRRSLRLSPETEKGLESPGGGGAEAASAGRLRTEFPATAYWNPSIPVGPDGIARVVLHLPDELTRYRLRATASCTGEAFGTGEARLRVDKPLAIEPAAPRFVRSGDRWSLGAVAHNRSSDPLEVRLRCEIQGARLRGGDTWRGEIPAGDSRRVDFRIDTPVLRPDSSAGGRITYILRATGTGPAGTVGDALSRSLPDTLPLFRTVDVAFGRAAPRAEEQIRLTDPGLQDQGGLEVRVAPSLVTELSDAVDYLSGFPHLCLEQIDSRLLGLLARRDLAGRLPPDTLSPARVEERIRRTCEEIGARRGARGFSLWPGQQLDSGGYPYLDGYTLMALTRVREDGIALPPGLYDTAIGIVRNRIEQDRERRSERGRARSIARDKGGIGWETLAFLEWVLCETGAEGSPSDADLERLAFAQDSLGSSGRICFALALEACSQRRGEGSRSASSRIQRIFDSLGNEIERTAQFAWIVETRPGWGMAFAADRFDRVRATSLAVILLSRSNPENPLLPSFVAWLLNERRHGRWANTHENALALEAIREYLAEAEHLHPPIEGELALGIGRSERFRFTAGDLHPRDFFFPLAELERIRRPPGSAELPVAVTSISGDPISYQLRLGRTSSALEAGPQEEGMILFREYVAAEDRKPLQTLKRGDAILVHLALLVPHHYDFLVLEDPLPAGVEAVNLRLLTSSRFFHLPEGPVPPWSPAANPAGGGRAETGPGGEPLFPVSYRDLRDDRARFYADTVAPGVYHLYYPVAATTPGEFQTPGARCGLLYSPEVYGTSGAERVRVE